MMPFCIYLCHYLYLGLMNEIPTIFPKKDLIIYHPPHPCPPAYPPSHPPPSSVNGYDRQCIYSDGDMEDLRLLDLRRLARLDHTTSKRPRRPSTQANNNAFPDNPDRLVGGQSDRSVPPQVSSCNNRDPNHDRWGHYPSDRSVSPHYR